MAGQLLDIARRLDASSSYAIREEPNAFVLEMMPARKVSYSVAKPVNVASVPQRSPFRYPGGKTWFVPYLRDWLRSQPSPPARLIEPFAGGAIVSLTAAFERLARHVIFAELDEDVASVWRVVLNGQAEWLAKRILNFDLTPESVASMLNQPPAGLQEKAFQTVLRNRVQRGGIMAAGLARRIREINRLRDRFTFVEGDGFALIEEHKADHDAVFYIDPPYTLASRRLYTKWQIDHNRLFSALAASKGDFLMSYDSTVEIAQLAKKHGFEARPIAMKNTHHAKMTELLIGKDLSWLDDVR